MNTATYLTRDGFEAPKGDFEQTSKDSGTITVVGETCNRCYGRRVFPTPFHGTCFRCGGSGIEPTYTVRVYTQDKLDKLNAAQLKREKARAAKQEAKEEAKYAALEREVPGFRAALADIRRWENEVFSDESDLWIDMEETYAWNRVVKNLRKASDLFHWDKTTPKQADYMKTVHGWILEAVYRAVDRAASQEKVPAIPEGRYLVIGKVLSTKVQETRFGTAYKMLLQNELGQKFWGTIPSAYDGSLADLKGHKVSVTATVEVSGDDQGFAFYKRPKGFEVLA